MRLAWFLLALPALAACGSSSDAKTNAPTTTATTTTVDERRLTQEQFTSAGNTVCLRSDRRVYRLGALSRDPAGWAKTAKEARFGIAEMKKLHPPLADQAGFDHMLVLADRLATGIQQVHDELVKKNYDAARKAQFRATAADTAIHKQARRIGLTFCQQLLTNWPA
jgi:hypothetical protein